MLSLITSMTLTVGSSRQSVPRILSRMGGQRALEVVREALKAEDALRLEGLRALSLWPRATIRHKVGK